MIRVNRLVVSRPHYAFRPESWRERSWGGWGVVDAVWFKRKRVGWGPSSEIRTMATMGTYTTSLDGRANPPEDDKYESWIRAANDNRYGGDWAAQWDGVRFLGSTDPDEAATQLAFLRVMLAEYPQIPAGYDGWWTMERAGSPAGEIGVDAHWRRSG